MHSRSDDLLHGLSLHGPNFIWLLDSITQPFLIIDAEERIQLTNPALCALFGYAAQALIDSPLQEILKENHGRHRDGQQFQVEVSRSQLQASNGEQFTLMFVHALSSGQPAEAAVHDNEARMRAIFETAVDAIITIDECGIIERVNEATESLFGYAQAELAGKNISSLMPEPYRSMHDAHLSRYLATGEKKIIGIGRDVMGQRRDGSVFPVHLSVAEMQIGQRRMYTGVMRDITESKEHEMALRRSQEELRRLAAYQEQIKEAERKRIAQEVHDELGGLLTGIKANLSVMAERAARQGIAPDPLLSDALTLADTGFQAVRRVITDLRPSVLDQLGVWAALEWYAGQMEKRAGVHCSCTISASAAELVPDPETSTMLFRIMQEAMTNALRHADAQHIAVRADWCDGLLRLEVEDDGCGMSDSAPAEARESWGIVGMHERARHFGGRLTISAQSGSGTLVRLDLPMGLPMSLPTDSPLEKPDAE